MRPIDADIVQEHLNDVMNNKYCDSDFRKACFGISVYLDDVPTLEVEPVKHGIWIPQFVNNNQELSDTFKCSVCNEYTYTTFTKENHKCSDKYCRHCGARMDRSMSLVK